MANHYGTYLQLETLLTAQKPLSPDEHDEMLFIIIHQVYELWFKQLLHEGDRLRAVLDAGERHCALATLGRMCTIMKTMVQQCDVLETMTPLSFLSFRERLQNASGFQSAQFRQFEAMLGLRRAGVVYGEQETKPSLYDMLLRYLAHHMHINLPQSVLCRDFSLPYVPTVEVETALAAVYHAHPDMVLLCERFVDFDEGVQEWRYRHVKMVERTIGTRPGTGGSAGVAYLRSTLFQPAFPELWSVRSAFGAATNETAYGVRDNVRESA